MSDQATTPQAQKTLVTKLSKIMAEVGRIPKNGFNEHFRYKFVREADLVEKLSDLLSQHHIFITSSTKSIESVKVSKPTRTGGVVEQTIGIIRVEYTFHDGDSGETLVMDGVGEIDQDGGKGLYKGLTGAMKYFLMKNFLVATGDDPEEEKKPAIKDVQAPAKPPAKKKPTKIQAMEVMNNCKTVKQLDVVYGQLMKYEWGAEKTDLDECMKNVRLRIEESEVAKAEESAKAA